MDISLVSKVQIRLEAIAIRLGTSLLGWRTWLLETKYKEKEERSNSQSSQRSQLSKAVHIPSNPAPLLSLCSALAHICFGHLGH